YFSDAPGLSDAAARRERRPGIEDFADRTDAGFGDDGFKAGEETARPLRFVRVDLEPGVDERPDQPGPHRALVIGGIAGAQIAEIARLEIGFVWRQRAQSDRRQQLGLDRIDDFRPTLFVEHRTRQRNREDLVRPERCIITVLAVDDVVEIAALVMPE